jgi:hypothetical protein
MLTDTGRNIMAVSVHGGKDIPKSKAVFFLEMNWMNLIPALLFRIAMKKVYFLTATKFWSKKKRLQVLKKVGLCWLSYEEYEQYEQYDLHLEIRVEEMVIRIGNRLSEGDSFYFLKNQICQTDEGERMLRCVIEKGVLGKVRLIFELLAFADNFKVEKGTEGWLWLSNDFVSRIMLEKEFYWQQLCPRWWNFIEVCAYTFKEIAPRLLTRVAKLSKRVWCICFNEQAILNAAIGMKRSSRSDWSGYEVAYFPHKGVYYGNLFKKDQYYASNLDSSFHSSKIMHLSLGEDQRILRHSLKYYEEHNIPFGDWYDIPVVPKGCYGSICRFILKLTYIQWKTWDPSLILLYSKIYYLIRTDLRRLEQMHNLKIILIGYEVLFPITLSLACRLANIRTVATHERMQSAWRALGRFIVDEFFTFGPEARKELEQCPKTVIGKIHEIGPVRMPKHYEALQKRKELRAMLPCFKWIVLVLDCHSKSDWYDNGRWAVTWSFILRFYENILRLCMKFPAAYFLIKGKNCDFLQIPFFADIVARIKETPNCEVVQDFEKWTPFNAVAVSDIAIGWPTSLMEEGIALGKPAIFFTRDNSLGFKIVPLPGVDYGPEVNAYTYKDLEGKLQAFFDDPDEYNKYIEPLRKRLYTFSDRSVSEILQKALNDILLLQDTK